MSALAEALVAAQRRAIATLEKAYLAGEFEDDEAIGIQERLTAIGRTDTVDQSYLVNTLDTLRQWGASLPNRTREQWRTCRTAARDGGATRPDRATREREERDRAGGAADERTGARSDRHLEGRDLRSRQVGDPVLMANLVLILELPRDWSDAIASILAERLVEQELPPGITVKVAYWSQDDQDYNATRTWVTT